MPDMAFLKGDLTTEDGILLFASDFQLSQLSQKKTWYMAGTFKAAKAPFMQLFAIHGFVRPGECQKTSPTTVCPYDKT